MDTRKHPFHLPIPSLFHSQVWYTVCRDMCVDFSWLLLLYKNAFSGDSDPGYVFLPVALRLCSLSKSPDAAGAQAGVLARQARMALLPARVMLMCLHVPPPGENLVCLSFL